MSGVDEDSSDRTPDQTKARSPKGGRTRARLLTATIKVLGDVGYEAASVLEITKAAHVSNATFYLYFKNKWEVMDAAVFQVAHEITRQIHEEEQAIPDIVGKTVYGIRRFVATVLANPAWAKAMLAAYAALPELRAYMGQYTLRTLHQGIEEGAFHIQGSPLEVEALGAVVMLTVRLQLDGTAGPKATDECIELIQRMLGVVGEPDRPRNRGQIGGKCKD